MDGGVAVKKTFMRGDDGVIVNVRLDATGEKFTSWPSHKELTDDEIGLIHGLWEALYKDAHGPDRVFIGIPYFFDNVTIVVNAWAEFKNFPEERDKFCGLLIHSGYVEEGE